MKLSPPVQRLVDFSRDQFGEQLSQFLLAGLWEEEVGQRWRFLIKYVGEGNSLLTRRVAVITYESEDGSSSLPRRRDPLVLLALLQLLLRSDDQSPSTLRFLDKDLLSLLGWKDTRKARVEMDQAIRRYFQLTYKWSMNKEELEGNSLSHFTSQESILSERRVVDEGDGGLHRLAFSPDFIEALLHRSLFGLDWYSVRTISRPSSSGK